MGSIRTFFRKRWRKFSITYLGAVPEGTYERYGTRGVRWTYHFHTMVFPIGLVIFFVSNNLSRSQLTTRDEVLSHLDFNRQKFYGRDAGFRPDYVDKVTTIYDGTRGFVQMDHVTGIHRTTEGRYAGPSKYELEARLANAPVSDQMLDRAKELNERLRSDSEAGPQRRDGRM